MTFCFALSIYNIYIKIWVFCMLLLITMLFFCVILINYLFHSLFTVELCIHKSVTEIQQNYSGNGIYTYLFKKNEYENRIDDSINWNWTPFIKQELYNTMDSLKNALVILKQSTDVIIK